MAGLTVSPLVAAYSTTKHAVVGLSQALRAEAAMHGVRVSTLCPGLIDTRILDNAQREGRIEGVESGHISQVLERLWPMDSERFARKVIAQVRRNKGVIIVPGFWKIFWLVNRVMPNLLVSLMARGMPRQMEALGANEADSDR